MVVYDITDPQSFNDLNTWLIEIEKYVIFKLNKEMLLREYIRF